MARRESALTIDMIINIAMSLISMYNKRLNNIIINFLNYNKN